MNKTKMEKDICKWKKRVVHYKNSRTGRTICGKSYKIPIRDVTQHLENVTCKGCLHNISKSKWVKKMIESRNNTSKSSQEIINDILYKDADKIDM
jgi:hypothetical protein